MKLLLLFIIFATTLFALNFTEGDKVLFSDTNKIKNGSLENGFSGFQNSGAIATITTTHSSGNYGLKVSASAANQSILTPYFFATEGMVNSPAIAQVKYKLASSSAANISFQVYNTDTSAVVAESILSNTVTPNKWNVAPIIFTPNTSSQNYALRLMTSGAISGNAYFDDFSVYDYEKSKPAKEVLYGRMSIATSWATNSSFLFAPTPTGLSTLTTYVSQGMTATKAASNAAEISIPMNKGIYKINLLSNLTSACSGIAGIDLFDGTTQIAYTDIQAAAGASYKPTATSLYNVPTAATKTFTVNMLNGCANYSTITWFDFIFERVDR